MLRKLPDLLSSVSTLTRAPDFLEHRSQPQGGVAGWLGAQLVRSLTYCKSEFIITPKVVVHEGCRRLPPTKFHSPWWRSG